MTGLEPKPRRTAASRRSPRTDGKSASAAAPLLTRPEPASDHLSAADLLQKSLAAGVMMVDAHGRITAINEHARALLRVPGADPQLPTLAQLPAPVRTFVTHLLAGGATAREQQLEIHGEGRNVVTLHLNALPLEPAGNKTGVVFVFHDLTPARQVEQHILQLDRLASIGTLSAAMAHEIKNALVAGKTFVDLLLEKHQDAELVEVVRREMSRIDALVSRMRNFAGPARLSYRAVRLHEVLDHSLRLIQPQIEGKDVTVNRSFLAAADLVHGDDYQLQQSCVNLFLNALDAMGASGTLSVATANLPIEAAPGASADTAARQQILLTIRDSGHGIAPEHLERLFEPFFTTKPTGTGLGLPITRRIIQEHQGAITVQSQPNQGTTFQILLPLCT